MSNFSCLKDKKVLLVSHELTITGAPLLLAETGAAMAKSGAEVLLTNLGKNDSRFPLARYEGLRTVDLDDSFDIASEADIIIANTAVAKNWVSTLAGLDSDATRRVIWWIHEIDLGYATEMECLGSVAAAVFDSECSLRQWQTTELRMPSTVKVIHPGVTEQFLSDASRLRDIRWWRFFLRSMSKGSRPSPRDQIRRELGVDQQDFLITLIGSYAQVKGQDLLVETVGQMLHSSPDLPLKLLLVGFKDIEKESFLKGLSAVQFAAVDLKRVITPVADAMPYYLASDAFVMNSQPPGETFGRVTIEAMAFGLPVLGTDNGGTREIVIDGATGLLHPPGKEGQSILSKNILVLLGDRARARSLGKAGFKRVKTQFRADRFYREFAQVMGRVVAGTD